MITENKLNLLDPKSKIGGSKNFICGSKTTCRIKQNLFLYRFVVGIEQRRKKRMFKMKILNGSQVHFEQLSWANTAEKPIYVSTIFHPYTVRVINWGQSSNAHLGQISLKFISMMMSSIDNSIVCRHTPRLMRTDQSLAHFWRELISQIYKEAPISCWHTYTF